MEVQVLAVVGALLTILMSVNAFYLKGVLSDLQFVKIELAKLITDHGNYKETVIDNRREVKSLRDRVHTLEGSQAQLLRFIEDYSKDFK